MTSQLAAHGDGNLALLHERVARARRSVVAIRAGALVTTGWVALGNGVVVASRRGLGYPTEVALTFEDGRSMAGRVIAADVGRDVALVAPAEPPGVAALAVRAAAEPRLGERAAVLSCLPGQSLRLAVARVCHVARKVDGQLPAFELDVAAPLGAPVLDPGGAGDRRGRGAVRRGRGARRATAPCSRRARSSRCSPRWIGRSRSSGTGRRCTAARRARSRSTSSATAAWAAAGCCRTRSRRPRRARASSG